MRKFSSYGPVNKNSHYYAPRQELLELAYQRLVGENPDEGGHYITVWGARQTGKTWVMQQILYGLQTQPEYSRFEVLKLNLEHLKMSQDVNQIVQIIAREIIEQLGLEPIEVNELEQFYQVFKRTTLKKPLILILDEFDALMETAISAIVGVLRNIYNSRSDQFAKPTQEKDYLLHSVALIGVHSVLGLDNMRGSPFNVQRGLPIPNLTAAEVTGMFEWYERESGQKFEAGVIERVYEEFRGQPGLTSWFGELLSETFNKHQPMITMRDFDIAYAAATDALPNNNILNIISKAKQEPYRQFVLELFKAGEKQKFRYDEPLSNFLYMHGVIDQELVNETDRYLRFTSPFVQKRLFNYFAYDLFRYMGRLFDPFEPLADVFTPQGLDMKALLGRYERYLQQNRDWLLKHAPRREDLRIYEAVYHFNLYMYLKQFLGGYNGQVYPEFPTGNGKIDLIIQYEGQMYGLELKSFSNERDYQKALLQAALYGQQLGLVTITLAIFVEQVDATNRAKYEGVYHDVTTGVTVIPVFVATEM